MEQIKYIPGDLVFHYIPKTTIKKYVKVYVCSTNNALSLEDMDGHLYDYIGVLYPIPLTPEILEKNGWDKDEECSFKTQLYYKKKLGVKTIFVIVREEGSIVVCDKVRLRIIKYIHELQHLLFGLDLNSDMNL